MRRQLLCSTHMTPPAAFANTNAGSTLWICATPQPSDLTLGQFQALTYVQVKGVGSHGETGSSTNILTYDTWDTDVIQKGKGITNAGDPEIELARVPTDAGQIILRAAALTNLNYAFKIIRNDAVTVGGQATVRYNRGLVVGPRTPNGRNEDFDLEVFTLGLQQRQVTQDAGGAGNKPVNTVAPAITGTATVGQVLTLSNGTFTGDATITYQYQWLAGGTPIDGANAGTFTLTAAQTGKVITAIVTATNGAGSAQGFAAPTGAVAP